MIIALIFNALIVHIASGENIASNDLTTPNEVKIQEAFEFSNIVRSTLQEYIYEALPPVARSEGNMILQEVQERLSSCESLARTTLNLEEYKVCSSLLLHNGMQSLGSLQAKYRPPTSAASRLKLLW